MQLCKASYKKLPARQPLFRQWRRVLNKIDQGGVIAYPTEAVWGLGCDPFNEHAVYRILGLKRRKISKGLILVAADIDQLGGLLSSLTLDQLVRIQTTGVDSASGTSSATTWLLPHGDLIPPWITGGHSTVAVRVSHHPVVQSLCTAFGGMLVSTSANPAGMAPARSELQARCYFASRIDGFVSGSVLADENPSSIIDLLTGHVVR